MVMASVLLVQLETSASNFASDLPPDDQLRKPAVAHVFLCTGSVVQPGPTIEGAKAFDLCYRNGRLRADELSNTRCQCGEETVYVFPSPLHRWFVEWKVCLTPFPQFHLIQTTSYR